jgi:hypothetical protein
VRIRAVIFEPVSPITGVKIFVLVMLYEELSLEPANLSAAGMLLQ